MKNNHTLSLTISSGTHGVPLWFVHVTGHWSVSRAGNVSQNMLLQQEIWLRVNRPEAVVQGGQLKGLAPKLQRVIKLKRAQ